ncbi:ankyrin repeat domain-containing protein [Sulfurimonas sp.]
MNVNNFKNIVKTQDTQLLQQLINSGKITLKNKNIVVILYVLEKFFWEDNKEINLEFFKCLLKNDIPINATLSKDSNTTAITTIISDIENNRNVIEGIYSNINKKYERITTSQMDEIEELKDIAKYQKFEKLAYSMIRLLVKYGANPDTILESSGPSGENISLLEYAHYTDIELFKLLIQKGANVNIEYVQKDLMDLPQTPLSKAIEEQNLEIVRLLVQYNAIFDVLASYSLFQRFESYYLWKGVDKLQKKDIDDIQKSDTSIIEKVMVYEEKSLVTDNNQNRVALFEILQFLHESKLLYLNCKFYNKSIFDLALAYGDIEMIQYFFDNNIEKTEPIKMIGTSSHYKDINDFAKSIKNYKENGYKRKSKNAPIAKALREKDLSLFEKSLTEEIAELLSITDFIKEDYPIKFIAIALQKGANVNFQDNNGKTALMLACEKNDDSLIHLLLKYNVDIRLEDNNFTTAFSYSSNSNFETIQMLLYYYNQTKVNNYAPKLIKLLENFRKDTPLKYTTHGWDFDFLKEYGDFRCFIEKVKVQWDENEQELYELSPNLHTKIYNFLFADKNSIENWCSKDGDELAIGWSALDGLEKWCNEGNDPFKFKLSKTCNVKGKDIQLFGDIIALFKQEVQIRRENNVLENIFLDKEDELDYEFDFTLIKLKGKQFYTDTEKFIKALNIIFDQFADVSEFKKIIVEVSEDNQGRYYDFRITQNDSFSSQGAPQLLKKVNGGDFSTIKQNLQNLCDWSVENCYNGECFRVNFLKSSNIKDIESIDYNIQGFTHILRFYL